MVAQGRIVWVSGPAVKADGMSEAKMYETVSVGDLFAGALLTISMVSVHFGSVSAWWPNEWPAHWPEFRWGIDPDPKVRTFFAALIGTFVWFRQCT